MTDPVQYIGSFNGLWTDRVDAAVELERRLAEGTVSPSDGERLRHFIEKGYVVLPEAVDLALCQLLRADIERAWRDGDERLSMFPPGSQSPLPLVPNTPTERARVVDVYVYYESARRALFSPAIVSFFELLFERPPLLFQSLSFEKGSQQGMHQDTAYVVCSSPLELAACWIALQDVAEGTGELMYYEGSHRIPEYKFSDAYKHWNPERDGDAQHAEWAARIESEARRLDLARRTFLPRMGDALIWAADLAHGGSPVVDLSASRKSLVGHYCPLGVEPNYFGYRSDRRVTVASGSGYYSSEHYDCSQVEALESDQGQLRPSADAPTGLRGQVRQLLRRGR